MITALRSLISLVVDNPIIVKDGVLALRRRKTLFAFGFAAVSVAVVSVLVWLDESRVLSYNYSAPPPVGDDLFMVMLGLALLASAVIVPGLASSSISGEREHGTLPLLTVTGLSPARIVFGKIAATVVLAVPFVALTLPPMLLGAASAGVPAPPVLVALVVLPVALVAFASVGVFASSITQRSRTSAPGALIAAGFPALFIALPAFVACGDAVGGRMRPDSVALAVGSIALGVVVAAGAAYGAWSALSPRSVPRFKKAMTLVLAIVVGLPLVSVALSCCDWEFLVGGTRTFHSDHPHIPALMTSALFSSIAVLLMSAGVARDPRAPSPALVVPLTSLLAIAALLVATMVIVDPSEFRPSSRASAGGVAALIQLFAAASLASMMGRFIKTAPLAAIIGGGITLAVVLIPAVLDEVLIGTPPLAFLNFSYIREDNVVASVVFWGLVSCVALAVASRRRSARSL